MCKVVRGDGVVSTDGDAAHGGGLDARHGGGAAGSPPAHGRLGRRTGAHSRRCAVRTGATRSGAIAGCERAVTAAPLAIRSGTERERRAAGGGRARTGPRL